MKSHFAANDTSVSLSGELTFTDHAAFLEITSRLFGTQSGSVVVELSKLEFIDSAGLGMLLIARDAAKNANRSMVLRGPQGQVKRMFAVTKFDSLFTVEA